MAKVKVTAKKSEEKAKGKVVEIRVTEYPTHCDVDKKGPITKSGISSLLQAFLR